MGDARIASCARNRSIRHPTSATPPDARDPRAEAFGHICRRCTRCCRDKTIRVDPYEIARLARRLGVTTGAFSARWTRDGAGVALAAREDGACVFLGEAGCDVHPDRPLACRIYPLGHSLSRSGEERFHRIALEPDTAGEITDDGTIAAFLERQDAGPYMAAARAYFEFLCEAQAWLEAAPEGEPPASLAAHASLAAELIDMDRAIAGHCGPLGEPEPDDLDDRLALHLRILRLRLDELSTKEA